MTKSIAPDRESHPLNERLVAVRTEGVLVFSGRTGQIAGIHEVQPGVVTCLCSAQQCAGGSGIPVDHFVILMERRDMPRDIRRNRNKKLRNVLQLFV